MTRHDHPSAGGSTCAQPGCGQRAAARVANPLLATATGPRNGFVIIRPAGSAIELGDLLCLDCAHAAVDDMLMRSTTPSPGPEAEQHRDPT